MKIFNIESMNVAEPPSETYPTLADMKVIGFAVKSRKILSIFRKSQTLLLAMKLHFQFLHLPTYLYFIEFKPDLDENPFYNFSKKLRCKNDIRSRRYNK